MKILKTCEYCKQEFVAKTTVTKCCSDYCAKRLYKVKQREKKITVAVVKEESKQKPKAVITEEEIKAIQVKEYLTLKDAAFLLNISPLTLRRWTFSGKVESKKVGKKHIYKRQNLIKMFQNTHVLRAL